jgi:tetratricopeptide (TPR) repeat protein
VTPVTPATSPSSDAGPEAALRGSRRGDPRTLEVRTEHGTDHRPERNSFYDRSRILDAATRARAKKKHARAIELYRWILAVEPQNREIHAKLAPLLAETGQHFDAWCSFKAVARACLREGHADKALAIYREAALYLPREVQAWEAVARLKHKRGLEREAVETLLEGSRCFGPRWLRSQAIHLLRLARELDAWNFEVVLELARLLASILQWHEAQLLLGGLARRSSDERLRRVRAAQFRLSPGPTTAWRWLRAALNREPALELELSQAAPHRPEVVPLRKRTAHRLDAARPQSAHG